MNQGFIFLGIGFELVSLCLAAIYLGGMIDTHYAWKGYATITLILLMLFGWFVHLFYLLRKFEKDQENDPPKF